MGKLRRVESIEKAGIHESVYESFGGLRYQKV
jgi:hypothetical protein